MPLLLGVNLDHVATLRQARYALDPGNFNAEPCPVEAGHEALAGGADSLTVHVRGDRRHMQDLDARRIRKEVPLPLNLEMGVTEEMLGLAEQLRPDYACLVPEKREEVTTEGGLEVAGQLDFVRDATRRLQQMGVRVSLFINPDPEQIDAALACGAEMIELHTGCFANAGGAAQQEQLQRLHRAALHGHAAGLQVNAGHGINYLNIGTLLAVPHLTELNIGHSIVSRAMKVGLQAAVREMKRLMEPYRA
ncbi:MAG TPA: pyridoxine 5'-phosphate synthase [Luteolibacter sp.]|nr:pyridoxine 5'-phosphate synthase [Luteolibacter sp.]